MGISNRTIAVATVLLMAELAGFASSAAAQRQPRRSPICFNFQNHVQEPEFNQRVDRRRALLADALSSRGGRINGCNPATYTIVATEVTPRPTSRDLFISYNLYKFHKPEPGLEYGGVNFNGNPTLVNPNDQDYQMLLRIINSSS